MIGVAVTAAAVAYASIPDSTGAIHGCYSGNGSKQQNGTPLNIIDSDAASCSRGQTPVTWNAVGQQGPSGPSGASGPSGPSGATGPTGPSNAYTNYGSGSFQGIGEGDTQTVASVTLPIGKYTLSGWVQEEQTTTPGGSLECQYVGGTVHSAVVFAFVDGENVPVLGDVTITSANTPVYLRCTANEADMISVAAAMIAIQVGSITASE
jgi:hypothetical protein